MAIHHCFLHRVQRPISASQTFDRNEFFAIQGWQELNTGIDCAHPDRLPVVIQLGDHNRTGTAVTFGATLFRTRTTQVFAQVLQHRTRRIDVSYFDYITIQNKSNPIANGHFVFGRSHGPGS